MEPITVARKPFDGSLVDNVLANGTGAYNVGACRLDVDADDKDGQYEKGRYPSNLMHDGSPECLRHFPDDTSRMFYNAKISKADRDDGLVELLDREGVKLLGLVREGDRLNIHPTVKPTNLMRYLCRLVTPPGGIVLDPYMGSGSTGKGAVLEGFDFIGMELDETYFDIATQRIEAFNGKTYDTDDVSKAAFLECVFGD